MKYLLFCLLLAFPLQADAKKKEKPVEPLARIEAACNQSIKEDYKNHEAICECTARNLAKLGQEDLKLLARSYEDDTGAEEELQKEEHNDLILFDYDVSESCSENPSWNYSE